MDSEEVERHFREQLEGRLGRRLSDSEWKSLVRSLTQPAESSRSDGEPGGWRWPLKDRFNCLAAIVSGLAGVCLLIESAFVFSPLFRLAVAIFIWIIATMLFREWIVGFSQQCTGGWEQFKWLLGGLLWGGVAILPSALAGAIFLFGDRSALTQPRDWLSEKATTTEILGMSLIVVACFLGYAGAPRRSGRT